MLVNCGNGAGGQEAWVVRGGSGTDVLGWAGTSTPGSAVSLWSRAGDRAVRHPGLLGPSQSSSTWLCPKAEFGFVCLIQPVFYILFLSPPCSPTHAPAAIPSLLLHRCSTVNCHPPHLLHAQVGLGKGGSAQVGPCAGQ